MNESQHERQPGDEPPEPKPVTAVAVVPKTPIAFGQRGLQLATFDDAWRFAIGVVKSKLAPPSFREPEQVLIAIQYGAEIGLAPMQSLQSICVINGRPTLYGDALPALVHGSGLLEDLQERIDGQGDAAMAVCVAKRKGVATPVTRTFSVEDARTAGLLNKPGPWTQYRNRMLAMRARAFAFRDAFADVLRGIQVREEVEDFSTPAGDAPAAAAEPYTLPTE